MNVESARTQLGDVFRVRDESRDMIIEVHHDRQTIESRLASFTEAVEHLSATVLSVAYPR